MNHRTMNRTRPTTRIGAVAALLCALGAQAEVHEVQVLDDLSFSPNDLTIAVGDTVRWVNDPGGLMHDVTADDGSFSSGAAASSFTFEQTFDTPEEVFYHCSVHSAPGVDIDSGQNGRILVAPPFFINAGLNDAWFDLDTPGQGFFFTVLPDQLLFFLSWFTFDTERPPEDVEAILGDPGHRWVTAFGAYEPGDTVTLDVELTEGMIFNSAEPPAEQTSGYGTITITFIDCNNAVLEYEFPSLGLSGTIDLTRITGDNIPLCEALNEELAAQ